MPRPLRLFLRLTPFLGVAALYVFAWNSAVHRGMMTHCRNNLTELGNDIDELIRTLRYDPEMPGGDRIRRGAGREFWQILWETRYQGTTRRFSPFLCPFRSEGPLVAGTNLDLGQVHYRGPAVNPLEIQDWTPVAADEEANHGGGPIHVLLIKPSKKNEGMEFEVRVANPGDPLWRLAGEKTR